MKGLLWKSLQSLYSWVKKEKYLGWDPYDWLSSPIASRLGNYPNFVVLQFNVYSPINFRPWVGIKKGISNKAIALFAQAYLTLHSLADMPEFKVESTRMLLLLDKNKIKTDSGVGWASHYFKFFGPKHLLTPTTPDIVGTCEALKAFSMAYDMYRCNKYKNMASMAMNYLIKKHLSTDENITFFRYTPDERGKIVFNVSALTLEAISYYLHFVKYAKKIKEIGTQTVEFLLEYQLPDGSWPYSYYFDSRKFYIQIDYHQGFIIDGLVSFLSYITEDNLRDRTLKAIEKGVDFYMDCQFSPEGWSYYRYPIRYPIDIHNQAQGIITFSKLYKAFKNPKYLEFAEKIAGWTIKNMQDPTGYFYTHRWPGFVNKIPYMRWAQAWMMLALATLLSTEGYGNESSHGGAG